MSLKFFLVNLGLLITVSIVSFFGGFLYQNQDLVDYYQNRVDDLEQRFQKSIDSYESLIQNLNKKLAEKPKTVSTKVLPVASKKTKIDWNGPQFWEAISEKRKEQGLSPIPVEELLCTLAAIRLAEVRRLGRLDDHGGFDPLVKKYQDDLNKADLLNVFEFLTSGSASAPEAVEGLFNTLGHKALFTEIYKGGCAYAADGFGVVVASK